jgi:hypothetical protein
MSQIKIKDATKPLTVRVVSAEEAEKLGEANRVPLYRIKDNQQPFFMGYAERGDALRGAIEIRFGDNGSVEIVRAESDA